MKLDNSLIEKNTGISLIRLLMSFVVVLTHFGTAEPTVFTPFGEAAVPSFIFVSFFLLSDSLDVLEPGRLRKRFRRLLYPLLFWSLAYYILFSAAGGTLIDYRQLIFSMLLGSSRVLNPTLWYLGAVVYITGFVVLCCLIFPEGRGRTLFFVLLLLFCFVFQYSGMNYYLFSSQVYETSFLFGRLLEALPHALAGLLFGKYGKGLRLPRLLALMAALGLGAFLLRFLPAAEGFGYQGMPLFCWASFICVALISLPHIKSRALAGAVNYLAQYTLGVFCIHYAVGIVLQSLSLRTGFSFWQGSLIFDLIIWGLSLAASILMGLLSKKLRFLRYAVM